MPVTPSLLGREMQFPGVRFCGEFFPLGVYFYVLLSAPIALGPGLGTGESRMIFLIEKFENKLGLFGPFQPTFGRE